MYSTGIESPFLKIWWVRVYVPKNPPYRVSPAAGDPKDRRHQTVPLLRLRPTSVMRSFGPRHQRRLKAHRAGDKERAPCSSVASQLSVASSNTLVPPLIRPYPSSPKNIPRTSFPLGRVGICEYLVAEKTYRIGRAGDPCVGVRILCFPKPSVHGFPTAVDPADRNCRYLVQPPTVQSLAWLRGYKRPPRGGRGRCRRPCKRTPLRGRRRCAPGGRRTHTQYIHGNDKHLAM
jgi:hypothetical protein